MLPTYDLRWCALCCSLYVYTSIYQGQRRDNCGLCGAGLLPVDEQTMPEVEARVVQRSRELLARIDPAVLS
jgi:hypothetical protein